MQGKCETDMEQLVGAGGLCRKTCKDCLNCSPGDVLCMRKNSRGLVAARMAAQANAVHA